MTPKENRVRLPLSQLRAIAARHVLDNADGADLVQAADVLLDAGIYTWSVGELATTSLPTLRDIRRLFELALKELAIPLPSPEEAVRTLVRWHLCGAIEGRESPRLAIEHLYDVLSYELTYDRHLKTLEPERSLIHLRYGYDDLPWLVEEGIFSREEAERQAAERDIQVLEHARSWICHYGPGLLDPCWLSWNDGIVRKLAQAIADEQAWDRLPILADALEEAGCVNPELLEHCRADERHAECCWITEILLLKAIAKLP
jgi:hypothetical protein